MTRREQIEAAALDEVPELYRGWSPVKSFVKGAEWADVNPEKYGTVPEHLKIKQMLAVAVAALNKLAIAQMGELDYTQDFFELAKTEVRGALAQINKLDENE